jgi:YjbE family integral membrane protein
MGIAGIVHFLNLTIEVFFVDLLLSGDNAVVIALACRWLPDRERRQAILAGTVAAIALRVVLTLVASAILRVPVLKLLGGIALTVIAIRLTLGDPDDTGADAPSRQRRPSTPGLASVIVTVVIADLVMSADNVVALAAVAKGSVAVLALGLLLSVPLLMYGSLHVTRLLQRHPRLVWVGGGLLGWFAGDIAVADPLYAGWVGQNAPALGVVVPLLVAAYVLLQSRLIEAQRSIAAPLRPGAGQRPHEAPPPAARDAARPAREPRAPREPSARRWRVATLGGGALVGVAAVAAVFAVGNLHWMPVPADLFRYACESEGANLDYRPGGRRIRIGNDIGSANGIVRYDNQIDWDDYHAVSTTLGFVPPTRVVFGNSQSVRIDGGSFEDVTCRAH